MIIGPATRDVIFNEEIFWPWNCNTFQQQIPVDFDGEKEDESQQQAVLVIPALTVSQNVPANLPMIVA